MIGINKFKMAARVITKKIIKENIPDPFSEPVHVAEVAADPPIELISEKEFTIDNILDKKLINFDNKQQMAMFFVAYKSLDVLYKELAIHAKYKVPDDIIKNVVIGVIPLIIKEYNNNLRKRCKKQENVILADGALCMARRVDGHQCSRKHDPGNDLCKNHMAKLPNGRIDIPLPDKPNLLPERKSGKNKKELELPIVETNNEDDEIKVDDEDDEDNDLAVKVPIVSNVQQNNRRGRKSKLRFDPRQYDNEYVTLWEDIVEGEKVLVDNANNVYTFDLEHPVYIGKKDVNITLDVRKAMAAANQKK